MENMNQAETSQFNSIDLQLFAEGEETAPPEEPTPSAGEGTEESVTKPEEEQADKKEKPDYSKLGDMSQDQQYDFLRKAGVVGDKTSELQKEEKPKADESAKEDQAEETQSDEAEYTITLDGEKKKVKQSELIKLAQQGADYTKKTQSLADQRRQVEALMAALKVNQQTNQQAVGQPTKPQDKVHAEYDAAVEQAEKDLGLKKGEFNQFDPAHNFALQKVMMQQTKAQSERQSVDDEVKEFIATQKTDPMAEQIDNNFDVTLFKLGSSSPEGAKKAGEIMLAKQRFFNGQASKADVALLKSHWEYTRKALAPAQQIEKPKVDKPEPPKTETPGGGKAAKKEYHMDYKKFGHAKPQEQLAMLRNGGFLK